MTASADRAMRGPWQVVRTREVGTLRRSFVTGTLRAGANYRRPLPGCGAMIVVMAETSVAQVCCLWLPYAVLCDRHGEGNHAVIEALGETYVRRSQVTKEEQKP